MKPLERKKRRILLWTSVALFVVLGPLLAAYASGYRLDDALNVVRTGGIFIHSDVAGTRVYLNDKFVDRNGYFLRNTLIQNLRPNRTYHIRVEKDGYYWWEKTLYVRPNLVTEARVLMLPRTHTWKTIPATTTPEATRSGAPAVATSSRATSTPRVVPNPAYEELMAYFTATAQPQFAVVRATSAPHATSTQATSSAARAATTTVFSIALPPYLEEFMQREEGRWVDFRAQPTLRERNRVAAWLERGNVYAVWVGDRAAIPFYFCTITCKNTIVIDWQDDIRRFEFFPGRDDVLLVLNDKGLHAVELDDRSRQNVQTLIRGQFSDFRVRSGSTIIVRDDAQQRFLELIE